MSRLTQIVVASVALFGSAALAAPAWAQRKAPTQEDYRERYAAKLAEPWWQVAPWLKDYDAARTAARESGKLLLVYFTRSYAP